MQPQIVTLPAKQLVGMHMRMSLANNRTGELWRSFMPRRREIRNAVSADMLSMQIYAYPPDFSNLHAQFEKWAAIEVADVETIPAGMETFLLSGGLYAVFPYKGLSTDTRIFQYIFATWLPESGYVVDNRPHFEVLGERYRNADPNSEEDIYIPIKPS